ncbi:hypothetical protein Tco_0150557 [Tanacetum coccineum]
MTTLVEFMILSGGENRPPMLEKPMYDSWKSRMELYMQNREHGRMILESVEHGPLIWPTIEENRVTRTKKYVELVAKDLWERVQLLIQGTSLTKQERECKLYDAFDKFAHIKRESLHQYYLRFTQLINDMNIYKKKLEQFQVNTKFLNSLPPEWCKFVTDVKLSSYNNPQFQQQFSPSQSPQYGSIHPTQHYSTAYPSTPLAITYLSAPYPNAYSSIVHQDAYSGLAVPVFKKGDDPIDAINKMMSFLSTVVTSRFPSTNNQLRSSSNSGQQATIHDGRVTVKPVQGRQSSFDACTSRKRANISRTRGNNSGQQRVVKCFNCQGEGHMADSAQSQRGKGMLHGLGIKFFWLKHKDLIRPMLYDGTVIAKETNVISIADSEETLILEEESRSKMLLKQSDPMVLEKKSSPSSEEPSTSSTPVKTNVPKELPKLLHDRNPDISYLHVFGALCYPNNDSETLGKLQGKADIGIFIGYAPKKKVTVYTKPLTQEKFIETIHVDFDELTVMASEQLSSGPELHLMTPETSSSGLVTNPIPQQPFRVANAPRAVDFADSLGSTSIDQDAPSTSIPSTQDQ